MIEKIRGLTISSFENRFTFVTDCAYIMPRVFDASVSSTKVPFSARWIRCITHQLNDATKYVIQSREINDLETFKNSITAENIVATVKHASYNDEFIDGFSFLRKV